MCTTAKKDWRSRKALSCTAVVTHSGSVRGVVSLGSVGPAALWFAARSSSVLTSTIGSLDSSFLQEGEEKKIQLQNSD